MVGLLTSVVFGVAVTVYNHRSAMGNSFRTCLFTESLGFFVIGRTECFYSPKPHKSQRWNFHNLLPAQSQPWEFWIKRTLFSDFFFLACITGFFPGASIFSFLLVASSLPHFCYFFVTVHFFLITCTCGSFGGGRSHFPSAVALGTAMLNAWE